MRKPAYFGKDETAPRHHFTCPSKLVFPVKFAKDVPDAGVICPNDMITVYLPEYEKPAGLQRRLEGRIALVPDIDLTRYTARAVIDFLSIRILREGYQNRADISESLTNQIGKPVSVTRAPSTADLQATIQNPSRQEAEALVEAINRLNGLEADGSLTQIEVSVDFYARDRSDEARWKLADVLWRHLRPETHLWDTPLGQARCCYGKRNKTYALHRPGRQTAAARNEHGILMGLTDRRGLSPRIQGEALTRANPYLYRQHAVDGTLYFGEEEGVVLYRCGHKVIDKQKTDGTHEKLPPKNRRVRVEVRLRREALREAKIEHVDDIAGGLANLRRRYFSFRLPTVAYPVGSLRITVAEWRQLRREVECFCRAGVFGLMRMRMAERDRRQRVNHAVGREPLNIPHVGTETSVDQLEWSELNERTQKALKRLESKWA